MLDLGDQTGNVALEPEAKGLERGRRDGLLAARRAHTAATRPPPASHAAPSPGRLAISDDHIGVDVIVGLQPLHKGRHMRAAQIRHEQENLPNPNPFGGSDSDTSMSYTFDQRPGAAPPAPPPPASLVPPR